MFERDLPRLEGLDEKAVMKLISVLYSAGKTQSSSIEEKDIRNLVLGCCTQSVLAQVLSFLLKEESEYVRKSRPDLRPKKADLLEKMGNLLVGAEKDKRATDERLHKGQDTLLLHCGLEAKVDEAEFSVKYNLKWKVVLSDDPEVEDGQWRASFVLKFFIRESDIGVEAELSSSRDIYL